MFPAYLISRVYKLKAQTIPFGLSVSYVAAVRGFQLYFVVATMAELPRPPLLLFPETLRLGTYTGSGTQQCAPTDWDGIWFIAHPVTANSMQQVVIPFQAAHLSSNWITKLTGVSVPKLRR